MKVITGVNLRSKEFKLANEFYRQNKDINEVTDDELKEFYNRMTFVDFEKFKDYAIKTININQ